MRKMINKTSIEGVLVEKTIRTGETKAGVPYVAGKLQIDTGNDNVITVDVFEQQKNSKGADNPKYSTLLKIADEGAAVHDGATNPTRLRISSALELNDWTNQEGQMVSTLINSGAYINIGGNDAKAEFETDIVIKNTQPEIVKEEETGRLFVNGLIFNYRGQALPVKFVVENKEGVEFFASLEPGTFTKVWGKQINSTTVNEKIEASAFGEDRVIKTSYSRKEFLITGCNSIPYDEDQLSQEELTAAIQARNVALAEKESMLKSPKPAAKAEATPAPKKSTFNF